MLMLGKFFNLSYRLSPNTPCYICVYNLYGSHGRGSDEDISETRQQTTVVKHEYSESDGNAPVIRSARYSSTRSQKTTTTTVKTTERVLTNGDHTEVK